MKDKKRTAILLALFALIVLSFTIIYPTTPHQRLFDSTNYHFMTRLVSRDGRALWDLGPLSLLEIYPIAHGTRGSIYFLSGISQLTGISIEPSIFLMNLGWTVLLSLSSFLLGRKIFKSNLVGLLTTFLLFTAGTTASFLGWTASPRGFAIALIPSIYLLMIYSYEYNNTRIFRKKFFILFFILYFVSLVVHRVMYLFFPVIIVYFIYAKFFTYIKRKISWFTSKMRLTNKKLFTVSRFFLYSVLLAGMIFFSISYATGFFGRTQFLETSAIISGEHITIKMVNFCYHVARGMRLAVIFSLFGFFFIASKKKNIHETFLFIGICSFLPFSIRQAYIDLVWIIFLSLFAGYGFYVLGKKLLKKRGLKLIKYSFLVLLLLMPLIVPPFVTIVEPYKPERERKNHVEEIEVETAHYIRHNLKSDETFLVEPGWPAQIFTGKSGINSVNMVGIEQAVVNSTLRDKMEVKLVVDIRDFDSFIEFLEVFHSRKGVMYAVSNDPLFPEARFYRNRPNIWFKSRFMSEEYAKIVNAYNIRNVILDEEFSTEQDYIQRLDEIEYITYRNERFSFYPTPMP